VGTKMSLVMESLFDMVLEGSIHGGG